ncbi:Geranylgeranyl pyrophosphate synthase [Pitangus sulphuratus]|nr:Geranylgeranyl pyrophosphate synthase [Pitangus sulphuratus]
MTPGQVPPLYILGMTFYVMAYPCGQLGSAVLAMLPASFSCTCCLEEHGKLKSPSLRNHPFGEIGAVALESVSQVIIEVTEMLHNASLLVDDIEDNSKLRRGFPVAHSIYGIPSVINCANYVYFLGLEKVLTLDHPDAVKVFTRQLLELHKGQGLDIYWRDTYTCPTEAEYKAMVLQKTGGLFGLAVGLMQLFSNYEKDLKPLLNTLGLFFQIRDDYANLHSKEYSENKSFCEDLTEGKFSFPTIHAIWSRPESTQVQNILRQRTENIDIKKYCVHYLENVGSFEYTRNTLKELESEAYKQIESLGGNPELVALVEQLSKMFKETEN